MQYEKTAQNLGYLAPEGPVTRRRSQPCVASDLAHCDRMDGNLKQTTLSAHTTPSKSPESLSRLPVK
jgi:hypothetical protein